jgi:glucose/arabinose dehydrogenase
MVAAYVPPSRVVAKTSSGRLTAIAVATHLEMPASFAFVSKRRILYGELASGEIHLLDLAKGTDHLMYRVPDVATEGEQGLLGLALHPQFRKNHTLYAFVTRHVSGEAFNQVLRIRLNSHARTQSRALYSSAASVNHNGGVIRIGPDGKLYAFFGDHMGPANSQQLENGFGKIIRMTLSGETPRDNPFVESHVFAYGFRNSFGMAFDPLTHELWETENGPECNDEINRVVPGGNYGWGAEHTCDPSLGSPFNTNQNGPDPVLPTTWYTPTTAPTGAAFCWHCQLGPSLEGRLFFAEFNTGKVRALGLDKRRENVVSDEVVHDHEPGCILAMEPGRNGALYFSDCRGIYKLVQAPAASP